MKSRTGVGLRFAVGFAAVITLSLIIVVVALNVSGVAARAVPSGSPRIVVVDDTRGLLDEWSAAGLNGAMLVDVTRDLGYQVPVGVLPRASGWPASPRDLREQFRSVAERPSMIWVASHVGLVRSVRYVVGQKNLAEDVRLGRESGWPGIAADGLSISAGDEEGFVRMIGNRFPPVEGRAAVLNIDASYFLNSTPEQLAADLDGSIGQYRLVTLNRAIDATGVPQAARTRLDRIADILREQASK